MGTIFNPLIYTKCTTTCRLPKKIFSRTTKEDSISSISKNKNMQSAYTCIKTKITKIFLFCRRLLPKKISTHVLARHIWYNLSFKTF